MAGKKPDAKAPRERGPGEITLEQAAKLVGKSIEWIRLRVKEGYIEKPSRGTYLLVSVVHGSIRYYDDLIKKSTSASADNRLRDKKMEEIDLRIAEKKRELVPFDAALTVVDFVVGKVRSEFSGLPASITRDLDLRDKIDGRLNEVLGTIAGAAREAGAALRAGRDPHGAVSEDDA